RESSQPMSDPVKLIAPMLARFMATDRAFVNRTCAESAIRFRQINRLAEKSALHFW
ncbi:MAG: DUF2274 domain-containing protein, partial [Hyphomicrobiaceae bacterium]|nr:DUF2274 domain-containing protein [Hyphomicrobiaceae bacterium]